MLHEMRVAFENPTDLVPGQKQISGTSFESHRRPANPNGALTSAQIVPKQFDLRETGDKYLSQSYASCAA